jgi:transposase
MSTEKSGLFGEETQPKRKKRPKRGSPQVFLGYQQEQMMLLPPSLGDLIPQKHLVRVVSQVIDGLDLSSLLRSYKGGGRSAYHPQMLLKVLVYGYLMKIYTGRTIARALRQDIHFMWLSGMRQPDFRTLNDFRSGRLRKEFENIFLQSVMFLHEHKYIRLEQYFLDGTKLQANANRYTPVWAKNTRRYKEAIQKKIQGWVAEIDTLVEQENLQYGDRDLEELGEESTLTSEALQEHIGRVNKVIKETASTETNKRLARAVRQLERVGLPKLQNYEHQEHMLGERRSYSKTDPSATFMRVKDGRTLPAYNVLAGMENQFVVGYSLHQKSTETDCLPAHLMWFRNAYGRDPNALIADKGFGSEENYELMENQGIEALVPPNAGHGKKGMFRKEEFQYDPDNDSYLCPANRQLTFQRTNTRVSRTAYQSQLRQYQCVDCQGCHLAAHCTQGKGPRSLFVNRNADSLYARARERLATDVGEATYKRRATECESVFGDVKWNQGYTRYLLRGKEKVSIETGLLFLAHNLKKLGMSTT